MRGLQTQQIVMQQQRMRALGQMASGIAHDINNALSPAALYSQSLLEHDATLSAEAREYLGVILRSIKSVTHTVARMREFYREREPHSAHRSVDLNDVLEQVIALRHARWSAMPQEQGIVIQLQRELTAEMPSISGMEDEIRDALTNLIQNAVDAMPSGGTLTLRSRVVAPDRVCIEVADNGIGMSEDARARCCEPFFTTKGERGSGLGLAIVYGMLERHGGDIQIESSPGVGTTIQLSFPSLPTASAPCTEEVPVLQVAQPLRILYIDDDPIILRWFSDALGKEGHDVRVADGGRRGIEVFHEAQMRGHHLDVVITDLGMPDVDGRKVAAAVKTASASVPVILLTGSGHRMLAENDTPPNVDRVLSKPPKLAELRQALVALVKEKPRVHPADL